MFGRYITWVMILHGIEYQRPTSLNMRILADPVTYSFLAFMKSIFHFCLGCYCGGYSQNGRSNLSSFILTQSFLNVVHCTAVILTWSVHNIKNTWRLKGMLWTNEIFWVWVWDDFGRISAYIGQPHWRQIFLLYRAKLIGAVEQLS